MQQTDHVAQAESIEKHNLTPEEKHERKQRVLTQGTPSVVRNISDAIVIKEGDIFFLTLPNGNVPMDEGHGYGIYYHDCRFLNGYEIKLANMSPSSLVASAERGYMSLFELTNPDLRMEDGTLVEKEHIGIEWERVLDNKKHVLSDLFTLENFSQDKVAFPISFQFRAEFEDVFAVRGLLPKKLGKLHPCKWEEGALNFMYDGADGLYRSVSIYFSEIPKSTKRDMAHFDICLDPRERKQLLVSVAISESRHKEDAQPKTKFHPDIKGAAKQFDMSADRWIGDQTTVTTDSLLVNNILDRSLRDLHVLRSDLDGETYFAAGLPWFGTLFGRDSLITSLQTLAFRSSVAEQTLRLLAKYQGTKVDDYRDEQPGKILHELRVGEMARLDEIPQSPYYGSIDATILFLILIGEHAAWTGDLKVFNDLKDNVDQALAWMSQYGDTTSDGYIDYESESGKGLANQGWKDSGDAIINADGTLARPPIALVEVQGYAYYAKRVIAGLFRRTGDSKRADQLEKEAQDLKTRFNKDFWLEKEGFYALALQKDGEPCAVLSSNPGEALWTGICDEDKAQKTIKQLLSDEMYSGWGIRTLTSKARRFNPIAYHLGTVWPHDNSIIAAGFRRYGAVGEAARVCNGIVDAAMHFNNYRLPELFAGFGREHFNVPVHYPVACHPQAWAAGSVPYMVATLLGLEPDGFNNRLVIAEAALPNITDSLEVCGLRVGKGSADLRFTREGNEVKVDVLKADGGLDVQVQQAKKASKPQRRDVEKSRKAEQETNGSSPAGRGS